jgi:hypothetical protein
MFVNEASWKRSMLLVLGLALRFGPWLAVLAIAILSLVPGELRPHTGLAGQSEHFLAYFLTGFLLSVQPGDLRYRTVLAVALCTYSGVLETLQIWVPGRSAQLIDFAASSSGALSGMIVVTILLRFWQPASSKLR